MAASKNKKAPVKAKAAAKRSAKPAVRKAAPKAAPKPAPAPARHRQSKPVWVERFVAYAQENPGTALVGAVAVLLAFMMIFG